ncbi:MAG: zinc-dependent alcohol dehydrogenase family protein [Candidatus Helarchaeota archaeon]|nr:zinc-dependent alcohol dehydrogenase family protein [Candidatus Helarchaeota archaeon]
MKALRFEKFGDPLKVLKLEELPDPQVGNDEVRIKLTYRSINPSDLYLISGEYGIKPNLPATPGLEGTGYIDAVGPNVTNLKVGQRVIPLGIAGTWKEYLIAKSGQVIPVPDEIKDQTAAQLLVNPMTAFILCTRELALKKDQWLLQTAAGSTLGRIVLQIAKLKGFKTLNFVRRPAQIEELLNLGADAVICTEDKDVLGQVMKITKKGAHAGIDSVGGRTGSLALQSLRPGGTLIVYGLLSSELTPINARDLIFKEIVIRGFWLNAWFTRTPTDVMLATLRELLELATRQQIVPPVEAEYDLTNFKAALEHSMRSGRHGKVLLRS